MNKIKTYFNPPTFFVRRITFIFFDLISFTASLYFSFAIRNEIHFINNVYDNFFLYILIFLLIKITVYSTFNLYNVSWRLVSLHDLANIGKACLLSNGILFIIIYGTNSDIFFGFPRSVLVIDLVCSFVLSSGFKISKRMYLEVMRQSIGKSELKRTLIIGAGNSGEQLMRDINRSSPRKIFVVGFVDDDPAKQNLYLHGVSVLGKTIDLHEIIKKNKVESILISVLSVDRKFHRKILNIARECGIHDVKVLSTINDISNSVKVRVQDIKDMDMSDLIGRQAVSINIKDISNYFMNKRVLITGAAGSIGSEISRQVTFYGPDQIAILDINESDLSDLEIELSSLYKKENMHTYLCDISNQKKVDKIIKEFSPDVIFHAAAYKHVHMMEKFPEEAIRVNILGTYNLVKAANYYGVNNFILISTDKAVNPSSMMGASKRIAENIVTGMSNDGPCNFVAVRFGNVIGSRGSALPIFIEQLKRGGPVTVTHPEMRRFFMTIPEAVALVLQASATGNNGDVFVLDMGEPIKIVDLVKDLILLNNLVPGKDIKIEYTGMREGEKLYEELLTAEEGVIPTSHDKIFKARLSNKHSSQNIDSIIKQFRDQNGDTMKEEWMKIFKSLIPTFLNKNNNFDSKDSD